MFDLRPSTTNALQRLKFSHQVRDSLKWVKETSFPGLKCWFTAGPTWCFKDSAAAFEGDANTYLYLTGNEGMQIKDAGFTYCEPKAPTSKMLPLPSD